MVELTVSASTDIRQEQNTGASMRGGPETLTGGHGSRSIGVVSGFVLKLARQSAALTQDKLAEVLTVDVTTVQGWESGRRPLSAMNAGDFLRLSGRLSRLDRHHGGGPHGLAWTRIRWPRVCIAGRSRT